MITLRAPAYPRRESLSHWPVGRITLDRSYAFWQALSRWQGIEPNALCAVFLGRSLTAWIVENADNRIEYLLLQLRLPDTEMNVVPIMNRDRDDDGDRLPIARSSKKTLAIMITHGTDIMAETGLYLQQALLE